MHIVAVIEQVDPQLAASIAVVQPHNHSRPGLDQYGLEGITFLRASLRRGMFAAEELRGPQRSRTVNGLCDHALHWPLLDDSGIITR
jgi:hypothetical protein